MEEFEMTHDELVTKTIEEYIKLQRIEKTKGKSREREIEIQKKELKSKLESLGIVTENLEI